MFHNDYGTRRDAPSPQINPVIAATTLQARLIYEYLEKLGNRVLYCDTDSCIYVLSRGETSEYEPRMGNFLGDDG